MIEGLDSAVTGAAAMVRWIGRAERSVLRRSGVDVPEAASGRDTRGPGPGRPPSRSMPGRRPRPQDFEREPRSAATAMVDSLHRRAARFDVSDAAGWGRFLFYAETCFGSAWTRATAAVRVWTSSFS